MASARALVLHSDVLTHRFIAGECSEGDLMQSFVCLVVVQCKVSNKLDRTSGLALSTHHRRVSTGSPRT